MALSPETKRSVWIVVFAGVVIAFIGGTLALPGALFPKDDVQSEEPVVTAPLLTPEGPVPPEVAEWFADDLGVLPEPYPRGAQTPDVEQLLPQAKGSTFVSADSHTLTIEVPSRYVDGDAEEGTTTYVVYRRGDISVLEALWWRCDWVEELVTAEEDGEAADAAVAREHLEAFPDFDVLRGTVAARSHDEELADVLAGDVDAGREWLANSCGR